LSLEIVAYLSKIIFISDNRDFAVGEFIDCQTAKIFKASGLLSLAPQSSKKQSYRLIGAWQSTPKYGETFVANYCEPTRPTDLAGLEPFLADNIKGVGLKTAQKFIQTLGLKSLDDLIHICTHEKEKVYDFFSEKKRNIASKIIAVISGDQVFRSVMIYLHEHNIPSKFARKIYETYGAQALKLLNENPYRLIYDFRRIGFLKADTIAKKLGFDEKSLFRIEAACIYALELASEEGHCCLPKDVFLSKVTELLNKIDGLQKFTTSFLLDEIRKIFKKNKEENLDRFVVRRIGNEAYFYLPEIYKLENDVSSMIQTRLQKEGDTSSEFKERELHQKIQKLGLVEALREIIPDFPWHQLSNEQIEAVRLSLSSYLMVLTGGPGCGKTFVLKAIYLVQKWLLRKVMLCAPTGLAAKRMTHSIGVEATTIHKALKLGRSQEDQNDTPVYAGASQESLENINLMMVDETSMINLDLFHKVLSSLTFEKRLILVGDADQLPSIGPGNCLRDMIASEKVPVAKLTKIFRQSSESPIPLFAQSIMRGDVETIKTYISPLKDLEGEPKKLIFVPTKKEQFYETLDHFLSHTVKEVYELNPLTDVQVLVPLKKGSFGQDSLNKFMQNLFNPEALCPKEQSLTLNPDFTLRQKDKVIQTRNNYNLNVFNGDLGFCTQVDKKEDLEVKVTFSDKIVAYEQADIEDLQLAYALTVHKSQGSEFPMCVLPLFSDYYALLNRNLFYTAVTRAKNYLVIFGESWAIRKAIQTENVKKRFTCLSQLI
jgi:exodeoxyribonuclease V alpha subunit